MFKTFCTTKVNQSSLIIGLFLLRVSVAVVMLPNGYHKMMYFPEKAEKFMSFMGLGSEVSLALVIGAEFFCSLLLATGLLTRFALIPLLITMSVAVFKAHHGAIFGDGETAFLYLVVYVFLFLTGPGKYSADRLLFR